MYNELFQATKDYALPLVLNCNKNVKRPKDQLFDGCPRILKQKSDTLNTQSYKPNDNFISVRGKLFRIVPKY